MLGFFERYSKTKSSKILRHVFFAFFIPFSLFYFKSFPSSSHSLTIMRSCYTALGFIYENQNHRMQLFPLHNLGDRQIFAVEPGMREQNTPQHLSGESDLSRYKAREMMTPAERIKHKREGYFLETILESTGSIRHQGQVGSCWIHTTLAKLEAHTNKLGIKTELSEEYILYHHLLKQVQTALNVLHSDSEVSDPADFNRIRYAGTYQTAKLIINHQGLVTKDQWEKGALDIHSPREVQDFIFNLNIIVYQLRNGKYRMTSAEAVEYILKMYIEPQIGKVRPQPSGGSEDLSGIQLGELLAQLRKPQKQILIPHQGRAVFNAIRKQLIESGEPIPLVIYKLPAFTDKATGIMSIAAFDIFGDTDPQVMIQIISNGKKSPGGRHAVLIVDFKVNEDTGEPVSLLVQNSAGSSFGDRGYAHLYYDYFEYLGINVTLNSEYVTPDLHLENHN